MTNWKSTCQFHLSPCWTVKQCSWHMTCYTSIASDVCDYAYFSSLEWRQLQQLNLMRTMTLINVCLMSFLGKRSNNEYGSFQARSLKSLKVSAHTQQRNPTCFTANPVVSRFTRAVKSVDSISTTCSVQTRITLTLVYVWNTVMASNVKANSVISTSLHCKNCLTLDMYKCHLGSTIAIIRYRILLVTATNKACLSVRSSVDWLSAWRIVVRNVEIVWEYCTEVTKAFMCGTS